MSENLPESLGSKTAIESLTKSIREGKVSLADVVKLLVPDVHEAALAEYKIPLPAVVTPAQSAALDKFKDVFGSVVPTERRLLSDDELGKLLEERGVLDTIKKMVEDRKDTAIRTTILNHLDVALEDALSEQPDVLASYERDKDGHYLHADKANIGETGKAFSWEVSDGTPTLSPERLKELDEAGEIDHALYLEITEPVRVINEQKLLLLMSKKPEEVLKAIRAASTPAKKRGALYVRNAS